jgi:FkbM family methyltransferase
MSTGEAFLRALATEQRTQLESYCDARARSVYLGDHKALCRMLGHYPMIVDTRDNSVAPHLMIAGIWEFWIAQCVARYVKPGMRCIDVGANFGYYTVLLSHLVGDKGSVQAWEPMPEAADCLERTLQLNGIERRVELVRAAAGDRHGSGMLARPPGLWGSAMLTVHEPDASWERLAIRLERLDDRRPHPVDFIKVDAEGHEPQVWEGARRLLAENQHLVVALEFAPARYADPGAFLDDIRAAGFALAKIGTDGRPAACTAADILAVEWEMLWLAK